MFIVLNSLVIIVIFNYFILLLVNKDYYLGRNFQRLPPSKRRVACAPAPPKFTPDDGNGWTFNVHWPRWRHLVCPESFAAHPSALWRHHSPLNPPRPNDSVWRCSQTAETAYTWSCRPASWDLKLNGDQGCNWIAIAPFHLSTGRSGQTWPGLGRFSVKRLTAI